MKLQLFLTISIATSSQWVAAGWQLCFDVLDHLLSGTPIGCIVAGETMKFGSPRLNSEYAQQFGIEVPSWPPKVAQS